MFRLCTIVVSLLATVSCRNQEYIGKLEVTDAGFSLNSGAAILAFKGGEGKASAKLEVRTAAGAVQRLILRTKSANVLPNGTVVISGGEIGQPWNLEVETQARQLEVRFNEYRESCRLSNEDPTSNRNSGIRLVTYRETLTERTVQARAVNEAGKGLATFTGTREDVTSTYVKATSCRRAGLTYP